MRQLWTETGRLAVITNKADNWEMRTILNGYEDIINKSRPVNNRHKRMSNYERAAQFSPFAALTGLGAAISETARLTDEKVEQDEEQLNILNNKFAILRTNIASQPVVTITYFVQDLRKAGGKYVTISGVIKKIDDYQKIIVMQNNIIISIDDIADIKSDIFNMGLYRIYFEVKIMKQRVPFYYNEFGCITSECKDNCCIGGWEIDIDDETYERYNNMTGELKSRILDSITQNEDEEYCFKLCDGKCPMLDDNGLCEIHKNLGEDYLGVVCKQFPRYSEYYGTIKESGIGLACEEAARIILSENRPFSMETAACDEQYEPSSEYDSSFALQIFAAREAVFKILAEESLSIHEKLIVILDMGSKIQQCINTDEYDNIKSVVNDYLKEGIAHTLDETRNLSDSGQFEDISLQQGIRQILYPYEEMEVLNPEWEVILKDIIDSLFEQMSDEEYNILNEEFGTYMVSRAYEYRQLLEYLVFRYFAKSIYDYDFLGKCQMLVTNFFVIRQMDIIRWLDNHREYSFKDRMDVVHIFSRQVEYSEDNIENLYEDFIFDDIFKTDSLIAILWIDSENI